MENIKLYQIKYKLKTDKGGKLYQANILSYDLTFINRELISRFGEKNYEIMDSDIIGKINLIDNSVIDDILTHYSNALAERTNFKKQEKELQKRDMEKRQEKAEKDFWSQDKVINNGNLAKKYFGAGNQKDYT